jgi:hypothetical protein
MERGLFVGLNLQQIARNPPTGRHNGDEFACKLSVEPQGEPGKKMNKLTITLQQRLAGIRSILRGEDGAVTVDWVVLTAAIVGMGMVVTIPLFTSSSGMANVIATNIMTVVNDAAASH